MSPPSNWSLTNLLLQTGAIILTSFACYGVVDPDTLVHSGSVWKFLDNGTDQGTAWTSVSFQDSSWASDTAEFGYGDGDEVIVISYGPNASDKYITTYFRKSFSVTNAGSYTGLRLNLKRDDGAIVYLNGTEVYRSNMPEGTITDSTLASIAISGAPESTFIPVFLSTANLVSGTNLLAVEVHQATVTSSDLSFDLSLLGDTDAEVVRSPYLQLATPNSIYVCWRTSIPQQGKVYYGQSLSYSDSVPENSQATDHFTQLTGLLPGTKYYYAVYSSTELLAGDSGNWFYTPPAPSTAIPVRIWAMGDFGSGNTEQDLVRDAYYSYSANTYTNLVLWLGDDAYPAGSDEQYTYNVFNGHYESILQKSVVYSAFGNHDLFYSSAANQAGPYFNQFVFPKNGEAGGVASGTEAYYSFNYGNIHFMCLESNIDSFGTQQTTNMMNWINLDLGANTQPWVIVYFHCPPYSKGYHDSDTDPDMTYMRQTVLPVLENYSVDLVLSGHDHDYERTYMLRGHYGNSSTFDTSMIVGQGGGAPPNFYTKVPPYYSGTVYAVVGCAGELETVQTDWPHPAMFSYNNTDYGSMVIDVNGDTLTAKFLTMTDSVADYFSIVKHGAIGIEENETGASFSLFPNPAGKKILVQYTSNVESPVTIKICKTTGEVINTWKEKTASSLFKQIDVSKLSPGMYFVEIITSFKILQKKFIKE